MPLISTTNSSFTTTATPKSVNVAVLTGDIIVVKGGGADGSTKLATPTNSGAALTWTLRQSSETSSNASVYLWTAIADSDRMITVSVVRSTGTDPFGISVEVWRGSAIGASAKASGSGTPAVTITTTAASSHISYFSGDWYETTGTRTWRTADAGAATESLYAGGSSTSTYFGASYGNAGAVGAKTVGLTAPTGQAWVALALELKSDLVAPDAGTLSDSNNTLTSFDLTVTGASDAGGLHAEPYSFSTNNGGSWSAWQAGNIYAATGLASGTAFTCLHRVRDAALNTTTGTPISASTLTADSTPPNAGTLAVSNIAVTSVTLTVGGATDAGGLHAQPYQFSTDDGATWLGVWQTSNVYSATGLAQNTTYAFRHRVRDAGGNITTGTAVSRTTLPDTTPPTAGTLASSLITDTTFRLTVTGAADNIGLHAQPYQFTVDNGGSWSAWQASNIYNATGRTPNATHVCWHRTRDLALNVSTGTGISVLTTDTVPPFAGTLTVIPGIGSATGTVAGASDPGGLDPAPYSFRIDSGVWSAWQTSDRFEWPVLDYEVAYTFQHRTRDAVGNVTDGTAVVATTGIPPLAPAPPPPPAPSIAEYLTHRKEGLKFVLLDHAENEIRELDVVESADIGLSIFDTIRSGGTMSIAYPDEIDWLQSRIRITYVMNETSEHNLGVFIPASPTGTRGMLGMPRKVELYDKLLIVKDDAVDTTFEVSGGSIVTSVVKDIILSTGESNIAIEDSPETLNAALVWEAGTTKLRIINDLLDTINYWSLSCDGNGTYRSAQYVPPASRAVRWDFVEGENSVYLDSFEDDQDSFGVPNKVICVSRVEGETQPFTSTAVNDDPDDPYSYTRRGRWVVKFEKDIEATSQSVLDKIAARKLASATSATRTFVVTHPWLPIDLNDAVTFVNTSNSISARCVVQKMDFSLTAPGILVKSTIRETV